jgi:hypothetical protein
MKQIASLLLMFYLGFPCLARNDLNLEFYHGLKAIQATYRVGKAEVLRKADRVVVYVVEFDEIMDQDPFALDDGFIAIAPYGKQTRILSSKAIGGEDRQRLLEVLSDQIAKPDHHGGAFCHFPIHGIRIYAGEALLHEGTFCWACGNFSFSYPMGSGWLDTNAELEEIFNELVPIPQEELDRFHAKYPGTTTKDE